MIKLRKLKISDYDGMVEWMSDPNISSNFRFLASGLNKEKVKKFIIKSLTDKTNLHYAIVDEKDEYLGTISLKNINLIDFNAEYAIVLRKKAIGSGAAKEATEAILDIAFNKLKLHKVYLNVLSDNIRAIKFYEKMFFIYEGEFRDHLLIDNKFNNIKWYSIVGGSKDE